MGLIRDTFRKFAKWLKGFWRYVRRAVEGEWRDGKVGWNGAWF